MYPYLTAFPVVTMAASLFFFTLNCFFLSINLQTSNPTTLEPLGGIESCSLKTDGSVVTSLLTMEETRRQCRHH